MFAFYLLSFFWHKHQVEKYTDQGPVVRKPVNANLTKVPVSLISKDFSREIPSDRLKATKVKM